MNNEITFSSELGVELIKSENKSDETIPSVLCSQTNGATREFQAARPVGWGHFAKYFV